MYLSKLAYLAVKNTVYYSDDSFNYESFCAGDFDKDSDYALKINNVFSPLNEAIARLSDLDKIPHMIVEGVTTDNGEVVRLSQFNMVIEGKDVGIKEVISIGDKHHNKVQHKPFGGDILLGRPCEFVFVEFKPDFPVFSALDIKPIEFNNQVAVDPNIDLRKFGINDAMCNYIIEYVQGKLLEPIAPELANMHITRSETYFANIDSVRSAFTQDRVEDFYHNPQATLFDEDGFKVN